MENASAVRWPGGHRAALILSFDVDGEYGEVNHRGADDWYWRSNAQYDQQAGIWRILRVLKDFDVPATFCWVGKVAEERPHIVTAAFEAGHEISTHGWDHRYYRDMNVDEQRADLVRTRDLLEQITGERPSGHKTPGWRFSSDTIAVLQDLGYLWNMDYASNDVPFLMAPDPTKPPVVQLPPSLLWDDYSYFVDPIAPPRHAFEMWRDDLDVIRAEGKLMCLTFHPWVTGRPAPSRALTMFLDHVISLGDIWIARADHLASWWRNQASSANPDQ